MAPSWKPDGHSAVAPYLMVREAQRVIDFLTQVFGAVPLRRFDMPDGRVMHAEVRINGSVIMLAEGNDQWAVFPAWMHVYVADVDATYRKALELGAESVQEPRKNKGEPDRRGGVKDPSGNTWWIATQVEG